jgi:putative ABC transport system ATP-binding protein
MVAKERRAPKKNIIIQDIHKSFCDGGETVNVLKGITMDVGANELIMIIGPSGCGKTTLISIIAGTLHYDKGSVDVLDHNLHSLTEEEITNFRANNIGFLFQKFNLMQTLTCAENVALPLLVNKIDHKTAHKKAKEALEQVGQADKIHRFPGELSGGQQQLVATARAVVHEPNIVICDEPTSALDHENGLRVMKIMEKLVAYPGRSVIVVTHDHRIFQFANRIVSIEDGIVHSVKKPEEKI